MKTDRFSDSIRRKLESIRPDFKEKDWARMQATLLQHTTPPPPGSPTGFQPVAGSVWPTQPWLLIAAVSTAVLIGIIVWQRAQINNLSQTVSQLSSQKTVTGPRQTPDQTIAPNTATPHTEQKTDRRNEPLTSPLTQPAARNVAEANRTDTVYITRYVPMPTGSMPGRTAQPLAKSSEVSEVQTDVNHANKRIQSLANAQQRQTSQLETGQSKDDEVTDTTTPVSPGTINSPTDAVMNRANNRSKSMSRRIPSMDPGSDISSETQMAAGNKSGGKRRASASVITDDVVVRGGSTSAAPTISADVNVSQETTDQQASTYELATTKPLTMKATDWSKALSNRAGQLQPARTTVVTAQAAPERQPINPKAFGFRVGAGAEVTRSVRSGSVLGELLVGNHLTLGVGLGMASFAGGTYITDVEFDRKKRQSFRHNYARGIHPRSDIINIVTHTERLLIPISVGYRIPVSHTLSLLPSIGTTLNFQTHELVTFTYRQPFRTFEAANHRIFRPADLMNALNFGAGVEWKRNHWVWQAGPVVTVKTKEDPNWQEGTTLGLRARLFYQF